MLFDIYTIIFLALAVFIFRRLRSVRGQRTGRERPPYDPYSARDAMRTATGEKINEKIVELPGRAPDASQPSTEPAEPVDRWKGIAAQGSTLAAGLDAVVRADKEFDAQHFVAGARSAYEMIVTAFAGGDRRALKSLLSREVYEGLNPPSATARPAAKPSKPNLFRLRPPTSAMPKCAGGPRRLRFVSSPSLFQSRVISPVRLSTAARTRSATSPMCGPSHVM